MNARSPRALVRRVLMAAVLSVPLLVGAQSGAQPGAATGSAGAASDAPAPAHHSAAPQGAASHAAHAASSPTTALTQHRPAGWGLHGMAVFGGRHGLYASHLPMFHAPHDRQVVLRIRLADAQADATLRQTLAGSTALWTLAPERFDLHRLRPGHTDPLTQFTATFFDGHFERGGTPQPNTQIVIVEEVLVYRALVPQAAAHSAGHYWLIGPTDEAFLVKQIDRRPDFDIVVALHPLQKRPDAAAPIRMPTTALAAPSPSEVEAAMQRAGVKGARVRGVVYFETGDLR